MTTQSIDQGHKFDWGFASGDYAKYRDIYPESLYRYLLSQNLCTAGQQVLDLGTGTGVLPRAMFQYGAEFTGTDISPQQIEAARTLSKGLDITWKVSGAEGLEFGDDVFDVITACQCHIYFDTSLVLPSLSRMLKPQGRFCVIWMAWLPEESGIAGASERLVLSYNPAWSGAGYRRDHMKLDEWAAPYFTLSSSYSYDAMIPFTRESWHGRMKACRGTGASSLPKEKIAEFDREHQKMLLNYPESFEILHHVNIFVFT